MMKPPRQSSSVCDVTTRACKVTPTTITVANTPCRDGGHILRGII